MMITKTHYLRIGTNEVLLYCSGMVMDRDSDAARTKKPGVAVWRIESGRFSTGG